MIVGGYTYPLLSDSFQAHRWFACQQGSKASINNEKNILKIVCNSLQNSPSTRINIIKYREYHIKTISGVLILTRLTWLSALEIIDDKE